MDRSFSEISLINNFTNDVVEHSLNDKICQVLILFPSAWRSICLVFMQWNMCYSPLTGWWYWSLLVKTAWNRG